MREIFLGMLGLCMGTTIASGVVAFIISLGIVPRFAGITGSAAQVRLYENIIDEEKGVYNKEDGSLNVNPNSLTKVTAYVEPALMEAKGYDSFQFVRTGFFCADIHDSKEGAPVFNRIVSLKSSFKLPKAY